MTIEDIRAKENITVEELNEEIESRQRSVFYEQMADRPDTDYIYKTRKEIKELEDLILKVVHHE